MHIGPLRLNDLTIQLANRLYTNPEGIMVVVLVHVRKLVFLADFYVMKTEDEDTTDTSQVLLSCPFIATTKTKINAWTGELLMEVDGEEVKFNVY